MAHMDDKRHMPSSSEMLEEAAVGETTHHINVTKQQELRIRKLVSLTF